MKLGLGIGILILSLILIVGITIGGVKTFYSYEKNYLSYWEIADKSSTISEKSKYIDLFVDALSKSNMQGKYNCIMLETPNNSFDFNFTALKSLQQRLKEIKLMNVKSFEYQTAIQQITAQEQGEAKNMLSVFSGIYFKENCFLLWDWVGSLYILFLIILLIFGFILLAIGIDDL